MFSDVLLTVVHSLSQVKVAHVGSTVIFSCDTTDVVIWDFSSTSYPGRTFTVYEHPGVTYRLKSRYSVSENNLSINTVQLCDAGNYLCTFTSGGDLGTVDFKFIVIGKQY